MIIDLSGRTALVTGAGLGIGHAAATGLHAAGASIVINDLDPERVARAVERLGGGERVRGVAADLSGADGCARLVEAVPRVDILVNNVGIARPRSFFDIPDAEWESMFAVNVMSGVRLSRDYVPAMVEAGWGRVVFVSSECALNIPTSMAHYGMTKLAQLAVSRGIAEEVAGSGVTVNCVVPGPTRTDGAMPFLQSLVDAGAADLDAAEREFIDRERPASLLRRFARPAEVASLIVYLASEQAAASTGAALRVDGGAIGTVV